MKKYIVFIVSFVLLYIGVQILSGLVLTALYTPDIGLQNGNSGQGLSFGETSTIPLLAILSIATAAYFVSQKLFVTTAN